MSRLPMPVNGERGTALLVMLAVFLAAMAGASMLVHRIESRAAQRPSDEAVTATRLAEAKEALIAWAVTPSSAAGRQTTPGLLPFPDRGRDGNYDGRGDCVSFGLNPSHLLGRLPWAGDAPPCPRRGLHVDIRDAGGEPLWYAVSRNLVTGGGGGPMNPGMGEPGAMAHPWIAVRAAAGSVISGRGTGLPLPVAAVIIAPGAALEDQDRSGPAPAPENYLDRVSAAGYDNSDADGCPDAVKAPCGSSPVGEEFIVHPGTREAGSFNDRLVYITVQELIRAVEKRVLGEVAVALNRYRSAYGAFPWLASFANPATMDFKSDLSRNGLLPVHLPGEIFSTRFTGSWHFVDATPTTVVRHSGDASLTPPLADLLSGRVDVTRADGRCKWIDWTRSDCQGLQVDASFFRVDLGRSVERTVEVSFSIIDDTPDVIAPTSTDPRRRALSVSNSPLPWMPGLLPGVSWSIRITDHDGVNRGQREISIDPDTAGMIELSGIRFDLSIVYDDIHDARDELPEWLVENDWHHFIYVAYSQDAVPGGNADGDGNCATPVNTCLTLKVEGRTARSDVRALVISSGAQRTGQNRSIGDCDDDGIHDDFLCAYLEGDNSDTSTPVAADTYARDRYSAWFNDQLRVVEPLPP